MIKQDTISIINYLERISSCWELVIQRTPRKLKRTKVKGKRTADYAENAEKRLNNN